MQNESDNISIHIWAASPCGSMTREPERSQDENTPLTIGDVCAMLERKNIPVIDNRCWFTVAKTITAFPKSRRSEMTMVEGTGDSGYHVWMEVNGERFDPHYTHIGVDTTAHDDPHLFTDEKKWCGDSIAFSFKCSSDSEVRFGVRWNESKTGNWRTCPERVFTCRDLDFDKMERR